jgi:hypothetical protein
MPPAPWNSRRTYIVTLTASSVSQPYPTPDNIDRPQHISTAYPKKFRYGTGHTMADPYHVKRVSDKSVFVAQPQKTPDAKLAADIIKGAKDNKAEVTIIFFSGDLDATKKAFAGSEVILYNADENTILHQGKEIFVRGFSSNNEVVEVVVAALIITGRSTTVYDGRGFYDEVWVEDIRSQM